MATNGLFESQGDVLAREQMTRRGTVDTRAALRGSLFNLGSAVGTAGINAFGGDGRSQEQMRAEKVENIFQQVQLGNPQSMMKGVNAFRDAGFAQEAMLMMGKIPQAAKPGKGSAQDLLNEETGKVEKWWTVDGKKISQMGIDQAAPTAPTPTTKDTFQNVYDPKTGQTNLHYFQDGKDMGPRGQKKPDATPEKKVEYITLLNEKTNKFEKWTTGKGGFKDKKVGLVKMGDVIKEDGVEYEYKGAVRTPDGVETSGRFNKDAGNLEISIDGKWEVAPSGTTPLTRQITETPPIVGTPSRVGTEQALRIINSDEVLGEAIIGLSNSDKANLALRVDSLARKLMRDDRKLDLVPALDLALQELRDTVTKTGSFMSFNTGPKMKTSKEILKTNNSGYRFLN
jgi:hypothetical protein